MTTTTATPTIIARIHSKRGFMDAVTRLLGPRPPCDPCRPNYPYDIVWLVFTGGHADLRASKDGLVASVRIYGATTTSDAVNEAIPLDVGHLFDIADALPEWAAVALESTTDDDTGFHSVRFTGDTGSLNVPLASLEPSDHVPDLPTITTPLALLPGPMLQLLQCVRSAMGPGKANIKNEATHGVRLEFEQNITRAVATDGHRLHIAADKGTVAFPETAPMLLPRSFVSALWSTLNFHMMASSFPPVFHMEYGADYVTARVADDWFRCDRKHGRDFPAYGLYGDLPGSRPVALVRDVSIVEYLTRLIALRLNPYVALILSKDRLTCQTEVTTTAINDRFGLTLDDRFRVDYDGDVRRVKVHAEYLRDALNACGPRATLSIGTALMDPVTLTSECCTVVLMPCKSDMTDPEFVDP